MTDYKKLCAELVYELEGWVAYGDEIDIANAHVLIDHARAALAEADGPAVPEVVGPEWQPCVKLPITVHVREQRPGEQHVSTREGITPVRPDDLIMRGVAGEEYPIGRELFQRTYRIGSADEPAVPDGREPASVTEQPSDQDLLDLHEWMTDEWAANHDFELPPSQYARAVLARWDCSQPAPNKPTVMEIIELAEEIEEAGLGQVDLVRAALARWGCSQPPASVT